jgi:hypothetical protein
MKPSEHTTGDDVVEPTDAKPDRSNDQRRTTVGSGSVDELIANYRIRPGRPDESPDSGDEQGDSIIP